MCILPVPTVIKVSPNSVRKHAIVLFYSNLEGIAQIYACTIVLRILKLHTMSQDESIHSEPQEQYMLFDYDPDPYSLMYAQYIYNNSRTHKYVSLVYGVNARAGILVI